MARPKGKERTIEYKDGFRIVDGKYSSFLLYNPVSQKNQRFAIDPAVNSLDKAEKLKRAEELKLGIAQTRAKKRFEFLEKFHDQDKLFQAFILYRKKAASKSWTEEASRLRCYVFPYFIGQLSLNHPSQWYEYWQTFHDFLENAKPIRKNTKGKKLSANTRDLIVRAANAFIAFVDLKENGGPIKRLPEIKFEEKAPRGTEAVYLESEVSAVIEKFEKLDLSHYAELTYILSKTGMRVSEGLGLISTDVILGEVPLQEKWIFNALKDKTKFYGYILLKSQPFDSNHMVIDGVAKRAPLKKKKKIAPENNRVIPIMDKKLAEILKSRKAQCFKPQAPL